MSTRYVWNKYTKGTSIDYSTTSLNYTVDITDSSLKVASSFTVQDNKFVPTGTISTIYVTNDISSNLGYTQFVSTYPYVFSANRDKIWTTSYVPDNESLRWAIYDRAGDYSLYTYPNAVVLKQYSNPTSTGTQGSYIDKVSYSSSNYYPSNGSSGDYWYVYQGSDNIDPYSVTYSTTSPTAGDQITIIANTRTPTYGGTIYYQFLYSIDGGNTWLGFQNKSTTPSATLYVPNEATQFRGKVITSDSWGFVSSNQLAGANLTVQSTKAYIGVSNKARPLSKIYVGVNGKAREVIAGYIGVNGKAKKFM